MKELKNNVYLREILLSDLSSYKQLIQSNQKYHSFNGPYYRKLSSDEIDDLMIEYTRKLENGINPLEHKKLIVNRADEQLIGEVNWYWKSIETNWLEVGVVVFNEKYWGQGIGKIVLPLWINDIFSKFPFLVRIGLSTWSGNLRMIKLAERLGLKKEAEYKNARIVDGQYFDSLSYGIQKNDWENNANFAGKGYKPLPVQGPSFA